MMTPESLGQLVDEQAAALVLFARQWCAVPEDVVREAFLKLVTLPKLPSQTVPWLYRVVRNAAIDAARADRRRRSYEDRAAARSPAWFVARDEFGLDVEAATAGLLGLPLEEREVIVAHLWGGLTFAQIAEQIGAPQVRPIACIWPD